MSQRGLRSPLLFCPLALCKMSAERVKKYFFVVISKEYGSKEFNEQKSDFSHFSRQLRSRTSVCQLGKLKFLKPDRSAELGNLLDPPKQWYLQVAKSANYCQWLLSHKYF
jgi:hypothetical protein